MSENDPITKAPEGDPNALGDAGKAALVAERKRADEAEKALKDANTKLLAAENAGKSDLEKALAQIETLTTANATLAADSGNKDLVITRLTVGIDEGLPKNLIARLQGTDEATFKTDAASLRELVPDPKPDPFPKADPSQGPKGKAGNTSNAQLFAEQLADF